MKRLILLIAAVAMFACQTNKPEEFTLKGNVEGAQSGMVYLQDRVLGLMQNLDSVTMENGSFTFKGQLEQPRMLYLRIDGVPARIAVFMENSNVNVSINQTEPLVYEVMGSESHDIYKEATQIALPHDERLRVLQQEIMDAEVAGNKAGADSIRELTTMVELNKKADLKGFIAQHNDKSVSAFIARSQLLHGASAEEVREIFNIFNTSLKGNRYYDEIEASMIALERVTPGNPAIDIVLNNTDNQEVKLSDLQGNIVLISFWASWCPYCRQSNPELVKVYEQYGGKGFEVLGVSLDRDHAAWVKGIEEDGLKWIHVSDLKGWQSGPAADYAVRSIPQNVLIGADGTILERNVGYTELANKLENLLKGV
jgi:peroxiredoxin